MLRQVAERDQKRRAVGRNDVELTKDVDEHEQGDLLFWFFEGTGKSVARMMRTSKQEVL